MKCRRTHRNPGVATAVIAPIIPYAVLGAVLYFYGGKIAEIIGAKISGVDTKKFKSDVQTVTSASTKDVAHALTANVFQKGYISPAEQKKAIAKIDKKMAEKKAGIDTASKVKKAVKSYKNDLTTVMTTVSSGLKTATTKVKTSLVGSLTSGGIWTTTPDYISPDMQKQALAKIKAERGF